MAHKRKFSNGLPVAADRASGPAAPVGRRVRPATEPPLWDKANQIFCRLPAQYGMLDEFRLRRAFELAEQFEFWSARQDELIASDPLRPQEPRPSVVAFPLFLRELERNWNPETDSEDLLFRAFELAEKHRELASIRDESLLLPTLLETATP